MTSTVDRGRILEERIGEFFAANGYDVRRNVHLQGRSGGRHEIDVLAEKSDPLTTFKVAIECKAWSQPIEKDVVSKLHYVVGDVGFSKGIIVSLAGCRSGAQQAADQLGLELWGPDELRRHLGEGAFGEATAGVPIRNQTTVAQGFAFALPPERARQVIEASGKGRLGLRKLEELIAFETVWLPVFRMTLTVAQPGVKRLRAKLSSSTIVNVYECLEGTYLGRGTATPAEVNIRGCVVTPLRKDSQVQASLRKALDARRAVTSAAAIDRRNAQLVSLGIPIPCASFTIENSIQAYHPYYAGLLRGSAGDRIAAVNGGPGSTGALSDGVSRLLTANLSHLRECMERA